ANHKGHAPHPISVDAEAARKVLVHDDGPRRKSEPGAFDQRCESKSDGNRDHERDEAISRIGFAEHGDRATERALRKLNLTTEAERDELTDDNTESPGGEDRIERTIVQRPDHQPLDQ